MANSPHRFDEEFSYSGRWWLPDQEEAEEEEKEKQWIGTVTYKPNLGIELELLSGVDVLKPNVGHSLEIVPDKKRFLGRVMGAPYYLTLLDNRGYSASCKWNSLVRTYRPKYLLVGFDLRSPEDVTEETTLQRVAVTYSSLDGWMRTDSPVSYSYAFEDEKLSEMSLEVTPGRKISEFEIPAINSNVLFYEGCRSSSGGSKHEISIHRSIQINPLSPQTLDWFCEQIDSMRDLLAFLTGLPVESTRIRAGLEEDISRAGYVDVYRRMRPVDTNEEFNIKMAFPFFLLGNLTPTVFQRWFERRKILRVPINLCLGVIYREHRNLEFELLVLLQALEGYYQAIHPELNRPSLRRCLTCLRREIPFELRSKLGITRNLQKEIIYTRNYYTHYDPEREKDALKVEELYEAISKLILFVVTIIARDLKISKEILFDLHKRISQQELWLWQRPPLRPKPLKEESDEGQPEEVETDSPAT
ncbi:MAG: hypothetical protein OXI78_00970 [Anaerolineaceae bacterium]|nr:hypothetical protein [Anaerolineaceae bacterium]